MNSIKRPAEACVDVQGKQVNREGIWLQTAER